MKLVKKNLALLLLILVPALSCYEGLLLQKYGGPAYTDGIDPEYVYIFSSLSISQGKLKVGHIDHPGTPLQVIGAVVIRLTNQGKDNQSLSTEVISNPERYIDLTTKTNIALNGIVLLILGIALFKRKRDLFTVLSFQSIGLFSFMLIQTQSRLIPEAILAIPVYFILYFLIIKPQRDFDTKEIIYIGLAAALGTAIKLTFLPFFLLVFLFMKGWRSLWVLTGTYLVSFALFAFPVIDQWVKFRNWVYSLFMHSGRYGAGDTNIVDPSSFSQNFLQLVKHNKTTVAVFIASITLVLVLRIVKEKQPTKLVLMLWSCFFIQIAFISKHFAYHYIIPAILLPPFILLMQINHLPTFKRANQLFKNIRWLLPLLLVIFNITKFQGHIKKEKAKMEAKNKDISWLKKLPNEHPKLIVAHFAYSPCIESGIFNGYAYAGKYKEHYQPILNDVYPNTYIMHYWNMKLYDWNGEVGWKETLTSLDTMFLFINEVEPDRKAFLKANIHQQNLSDTLLYMNPITGNEVHLITHPVH